MVLKMIQLLSFFSNPSALLKKGRYVFILFFVFMLSACGGGQYINYQQDFGQLSKYDMLRYTMAMQNRLDKVAGTLQIHNADLCRKRVRHLFGFSATNKYSYSPLLTQTASETAGLGERLQVTNVISGSGAEKAGVQTGDILLTIEGLPVPQGRSAESEVVKMLSPIVSKKTAVTMTVSRQGYQQQLVVPLTLSCGFRVELGHTDHVNAYSDGNRILVTRGMMRFAKTDNELAYVIGKEMAHNVLNHARTLKTKATNRKIIDNLIQFDSQTYRYTISTKPMTRQFDTDSDILGLAMALRSGYEIDSAVHFWSRLIQAYPSSNPTAYTAIHPNSQARLDLMPKSISRIKIAEERRKALQHQNDLSL